MNISSYSGELTVVGYKLKDLFQNAILVRLGCLRWIYPVAYVANYSKNRAIQAVRKRTH
jgi:hypothetical protein